MVCTSFNMLILTVYVKKGDFAQVKLLYMVFASKGCHRSNIHCLACIDQVRTDGKSFDQSDPVYLIVGRGYLGWIEYIERVLSSLAMVFRGTKFLLC